jgi:LacI family transcriptional regulator
MGMTIEDVARLAGVSITTVSRAINAPDLVNARTLERINSVIEREGYKPNIFARGLMRSRTNSVGILVSYITNPYMTSIIDSIEETLGQNDTYIYLCNSKSDRGLEREYAEELLRRNVDALIVIETPSLNKPDNFLAGLAASCPLILVNEHTALDCPHHIVRCDQEPGVREALQHFLSRDKFPLALLVGNDGAYSFALKERLFEEFRDANGLSEEETPVYRLGEANVEEIVGSAARLVEKLAAGPHRPKAVFAGNDLIGVGALQGALAAGLRVPKDMSIIGVDNTFVSRICMPKLSTVDLRTEDVGRTAAELFLRIKNGRVDPAHPARETISSILVLRGTT